MHINNSSMNIRTALVAALGLILVVGLTGPVTAQPWMKGPYLKSKGETPNYYEICDAFYGWWGDQPYERSKGYKPFKRWEYRMAPKCFPDGVIPSPTKYSDAYQQFKSSVKTKELRSAQWTPMGLDYWINGLSGYNPGNGRINAVTVDPHHPNVIYAAAPSGGIWKSIDGGFTWNTTYDTMRVMGTSAIAIHPNDPNTIFVGTGDRDSWDTPGIGILKSTDGGTSWKSGGLVFNLMARNINKILINPLDPNAMFAAASNGIYRSVNGGISWSMCYTGSGVNDLKYCPGDPNIMYGSGESFVRSVNGGATFAKNTTTLPSGTGRLEFDVTADNPDVVYVVAGNDNSTFEGVYRSTDQGATFVQQSNSPNILGYSDIGDDDSGQAWYDLAIAVSPTDENEVWVGGINMWKSTDAGINWTVNTMWYTDSPYNYIHCDIHSVNFYGDTLYVGSDGGVFYTPNHGTTWRDISTGLGISQFYRLGCSRNSNDHIAAGAQDIGSNVYLDGTWTHVFGADGMEALISHGDENTLFVTYQGGGLLRSEDGGETFEGAKPVDSIDGGWVTPYVQHPIDPMILYAGYKEVWKTIDGGYSWFPLSTDLCGGANLDQLVVAASDDHTIYTSNDEILYVTHDEGVSWNSYTPNGSMSITGIAVDEYNAQRLWLTCTSSGSDRVYYSSDGGQTFSDISKNLSSLGFNCIVWQKNANDALYVGTETGIVYTDSTMTEWVPWDTDLPNVPVSELEIHYLSGTLRAATFGRGIWKGPLINTVGIAENNTLQFDVFPNPAQEILNIRLGDEAAFPVDLRLFTVSGALVRTLTLSQASIRDASMNVNGLAAGTYYLRVADQNSIAFKKIMIVNF